MSQFLKQYKFIEQFQCLGDKCEDTCCKGWGMQLDFVRKTLYEKEAPELLDAVTSGEADLIMRRDPKTDYCVKFDNGLCSIHKERGTEFLGDACHFYPRISRKFGDEVIMSGALSCPEIARSTLSEDDAFSLSDNDIDRLPVELKDYLPEGMEGSKAFSVVTALIAMLEDDSVSAERAMARVISIANSLLLHSTERWPEGIHLLIRMVDSRLPEPEPHDIDPYHIMHTLAGLMFASKKSPRTRLEETFAMMEKSLAIHIDRENLEIMQDTGKQDAYAKLYERWQEGASQTMAPVLRRWIQAQIAMASFPFAGFGNNLGERIIILAVRFATVRLALMAHMDQDGKPPDEAMTVKVVQSLSRFMDHLADPTLSINIYAEAGWDREPRLRALIGDS